ncbi:MAG: caspase family protein [Sphingosinicella sp.]
MKRPVIALVAVTSALLAVASASGQGATGTSISAGQNHNGELTPNDVQRRSGKYEDSFALQGRRGERIELRLVSDQFDPYLVVTGPGGFQLGNDDESGESLHSRLAFEFPANGTYRVSATSFRPGESGAYRLITSVPANGSALSTRPAATAIALGANVTGRLAASDARRAGGEYVDRYRFTGRRGQRIRAELSSPKFDTLLVLTHPDGSEDSNDDTRADGEVSLDSRLDVVLAEDGEYELGVSSFEPGVTGEYRLSLAPSPGLARQVNVPGGPRVIALLVGVSDYGGRTSDLPNTDEDAQQLYESLRIAGLLHPASRVLINGEATTKAVSEAFARIAAEAGPNDLFLFFFSGHGDQVDALAGMRELDGRSETIELFDAEMTDAQLAPLFASVRSRLAMVAIDACYAGGFRNLVDRPNVMGLFSSEEDLTSMVADRFKAGGFLSYFLRAGLTGDADIDGDRIVTAGELSSYVRRRFRREGDIPATTREDEGNFQNLLVERGGVHIDDVVVRLSGMEQGAAGSQ